MQITSVMNVPMAGFSPANAGAFGSEVEAAALGTALGLLHQLGEHHPGTLTHSVQVSRLTLAMWNLAPAWLGPRDTAMLGGLLHDIGKLHVPTEFLGSERKLSDAEFEVMREHPGRGALLLKQMGMSEGVVAAARDHHERWSGNGYPSGRPAKLLAPLSRAVAAADAFSAMIEPRSYCRTLSIAGALTELHACRGTQFDPYTVDLLNAAMETWTAQVQPAPHSWLKAELARPASRRRRQNGGQS